jgi:spoIIIJ-associated protein
MTPLEHARSILDSMLGYLGFVVQIEEEDGPDGLTLQVITEDADPLIGKRGQTMEDIQYLVNRILSRHIDNAPRVRVDIMYYRSMREDKILDNARELAERVRATGQSATLHPMNSYYRRIVHNAFAEDPDVMSVSADGKARFKKITLKRRK